MRKHKNKRVVRISSAVDRLLTAYISAEHGGSHTGFRVMRIMQAAYDVKAEEVVEIKACLYNGGSSHNGYNGKRVVLGRHEFARPHCGIEEGRKTVPVDKYVRELLAREAGDYDDAFAL